MTDPDGFQTMVSVFFDTGGQADVQLGLEAEMVVLRFGETAAHRLDLHVSYEELDRMAALIDKAREFITAARSDPTLDGTRSIDTVP